MSERFAVQPALEAAEKVPSGATRILVAGQDPSSFRTILRLAVPLALSMCGLMIMIFLNRLFLSLSLIHI